MSRAPRCLTTAMSHGDSRTTSSMVGEKMGTLWPSRPGRTAAPAEDDEVGLALGGRLDDAFRRVPADAHDRVDGRALGRVVEHPLEQPARVARARRALGQRHALGHLDDAQRGELADRGSSSDAPMRTSSSAVSGLATGMRIGSERRRAHAPVAAHRRAARAAASLIRGASAAARYGLSSSNSRACRSTRSSASSVVCRRFSMTKLPTRPK